MSCQDVIITASYFIRQGLLAQFAATLYDVGGNLIEKCSVTISTNLCFCLSLLLMSLFGAEPMLFIDVKLSADSSLELSQGRRTAGRCHLRDCLPWKDVSVCFTVCTDLYNVWLRVLSFPSFTFILPWASFRLQSPVDVFVGAIHYWKPLIILSLTCILSSPAIYLDSLF